MAKNTQDREDLLRDGVAMVVRGRIWLEKLTEDGVVVEGNPDDQLEIVIGFRRDGRLSLYWDQDPVFQFDADQALRRVYLGGKAYRAEGGRLCLIEKRSNERVAVSRLQLETTALSTTSEAAILQRLGDCLQQVAQRLNAMIHNPVEGDLEVVGETRAAYAQRVLDWIESLPQPVPIAASLTT
ncbi:hypothetical protein [Rhodopirellula sp. MGV]|uniref:hypothetical protein n=1 Tax=Rhodopirellula sp. MGV TaxID=2023130 RepID=UPI000BC8549B|nr:hypothetical protein [Rhodopirellula sp. MGV]OYP28447.1 hypothetical protein CGZ80_26970 [Rhodopirellula sp. MGV]